MFIWLHDLAAILYLGAGLAAGLSIALSVKRLERVAVAGLALGGLAHLASFGALHALDPTPPLTDLPTASSFMALVGVLFYLALLARARLVGLIVLVAPMAFLGVFFAALWLPHVEPTYFVDSGSWPHAHVLLASAGLAMLGLAAMAGILFLTEHRRLKSKRPLRLRVPIPSLEALDRVNVASLAVGFPMLTLGVVTGMLWVQAENGRLWTASPHEVWSALAWGVYAVLAAARFGSGQGSRQAAASAVGGFAFVFVAVIGVGIFR